MFKHHLNLYGMLVRLLLSFSSIIFFESVSVDFTTKANTPIPKAPRRERYTTHKLGKKGEKSTLFTNQTDNSKCEV
jgi:hypothetical protein